MADAEREALLTAWVDRSLNSTRAPEKNAQSKSAGQPSRVKLKWHFSLSFGLSHMIVAAIVVIVVMIAPLFAPGTKTNFDTWQSEDGEYYMVQGTGKDYNEQVADADVRPTEYGVYECKAMEEAKQHFGTPMPVLTWLPDGWQLDDATVITSEYSRMLNVVYTRDEALIILCVIENYEGMYYTYIEQDSEGEHVTLASGREVYITHNIDRLTVAWLENNMEIFFSGDFTREEALRMAESVQISQ